MRPLNRTPCLAALLLLLAAPPATAQRQWNTKEPTLHPDGRLEADWSDTTISALAVSPSRANLAVIARNPDARAAPPRAGRLVVFDLATSNVIASRSVPDSLRQVSWAGAAAGASTLVTLGSEVHVWDPQAANVLHTLKEADAGGHILAVAASPQPGVVAIARGQPGPAPRADAVGLWTAGAPGIDWIWRAENRAAENDQKWRQMGILPRGGAGLAFSPDGRRLALGGAGDKEQPSVTVWELPPDAKARAAAKPTHYPPPPEAPHSGRPVTPRETLFLPGARQLLAGTHGFSPAITAWDVQSREVAWAAAFPTRIPARLPLSASSDGLLVATMTSRYNPNDPASKWAAPLYLIATDTGKIVTVLDLAEEPAPPPPPPPDRGAQPRERGPEPADLAFIDDRRLVAAHRDARGRSHLQLFRADVPPEFVQRMTNLRRRQTPR